jgi:hypothetical protein
VSEDEDDEALSWAGGRDPSHYETPVAKEPKPPRASRRGRPTDTTADSDPAETSDLSPVTSGALLVTMGILAGVYLLYTVGWVVTVQHAGTLAVTPLEQLAFTVSEYLAIAAPALWFAAAIYLTRGQRPVVRLVWLVIGAVALIPWPFVFGIQNVH